MIFPEYKVEEIEGSSDALITCPKKNGRCGNGFIVHYPTWLSFQGKTRPCPYCFKASKIPDAEDEGE